MALNLPTSGHLGVGHATSNVTNEFSLRPLPSEPMPDEATAPLPHFVIIGAQKAGTRWLRHNLGLHPAVFAPRGEPCFFDHHFDRGINWYRDWFEGWSGEPIVGESTPGYMIWGRSAAQRPGVKAERIAATLPDARLFSILRDPCDRVFSAFLHHAERGRIDSGWTLLDYVRSQDPEDDPLQLVSGGWYFASLERYVELFGERLQILLNEDVSTIPEATYDLALEHSGLEAGHRPDGLSRVRFSNVPASLSQRSDRDGKYRLSDEQRAEFYLYFAEDIERLEELLGRDLAGWKASS